TNDAVVPQPGGGVVGVAFVLVLLTNGSLEGLFFVGAPAAAAALDAVAAHGGQHAGGLVAAHDGDACVGPHVKHARAECATTHAVVAGTKGAADDHGELGDGRGGHRCHHLGAVPGNPFVFVFATHHETGDVLQEDQRNAALAAQFDEVGAFLGGFRKQDAVVGDDAYRHAVDMGESGHQRRAEACLEFIEFGAVDDTGDDFAHVVGFAGVGGNDAVEFGRVIPGFDHLAQCQLRGFLPVQSCNGFAGECQRMQVVVGQVIGHARQPGVHVAAAQIL